MYASVFMVHDEIPMDPTRFAELLAEHGQEFDYRDTVNVVIPITSDIAIDQMLIKALGVVTTTTQLQVVEVVPGAASLYGKTVQNSQVAGLLKYDISVEDEAHKTATMTIDLKSTDDGLLEAFVEQLSSLDVTA